MGYQFLPVNWPILIRDVQLQLDKLLGFVGLLIMIVKMPFFLPFFFILFFYDDDDGERLQGKALWTYPLLDGPAHKNCALGNPRTRYQDLEGAHPKA